MTLNTHVYTDHKLKFDTKGSLKVRQSKEAFVLLKIVLDNFFFYCFTFVFYFLILYINDQPNVWTDPSHFQSGRKRNQTYIAAPIPTSLNNWTAFNTLFTAGKGKKNATQSVEENWMNELTNTILTEWRAQAAAPRWFFSFSSVFSLPSSSMKVPLYSHYAICQTWNSGSFSLSFFLFSFSSDKLWVTVGEKKKKAIYVRRKQQQLTR